MALMNLLGQMKSSCSSEFEFVFWKKVRLLSWNTYLKIILLDLVVTCINKCGIFWSVSIESPWLFRALLDCNVSFKLLPLLCMITMRLFKLWQVSWIDKSLRLSNWDCTYCSSAYLLAWMSFFLKASTYNSESNCFFCFWISAITWIRWS